MYNKRKLILVSIKFIVYNKDLVIYISIVRMRFKNESRSKKDQSLEYSIKI